MNKKIILVLLILFLTVSSMSTASAWWIFGGGNDVTVNGLSFHLPEGFDTDNPVSSISKETYENRVYMNTENKDTVEIHVEDKHMEDSDIINYLIQNHYEKQSIDGKEGYYKMDIYTKNVEFIYIDNDKLVSITVPYVYDQYGDDFKQYDELLGEII